MKEKKIRIFLSILVLIIWGSIFYRVGVHLLGDDSEKINMLNENYPVKYDLSKLKNNKYEYKNLNRDPFVMNVNKEKEKNISHKIKRAKIEETPLKYTIKGVIIKEGREVVLVEDETNSKIVFLREGMHYKGIKIVKISDKGVSVLSNKKLTKHALK